MASKKRRGRIQNAGVSIELPATWVKYQNGLCNDCVGSCCSLPVEAKLSDLVRMELVDAFEADGPVRKIAKSLKKAGLIEHFNSKREVFTLARMASGDCNWLDQKTRLCTIYDKRPDICRNHPQVGPRPGHCAYIKK